MTTKKVTRKLLPPAAGEDRAEDIDTIRGMLAEHTTETLRRLETEGANNPCPRAEIILAAINLELCDRLIAEIKDDRRRKSDALLTNYRANKVGAGWPHRSVNR